MKVRFGAEESRVFSTQTTDMPSDISDILQRQTDRYIDSLQKSN